MKRLKLALAAATLCAALYGGYVAYDYATMTEQERMFLANVEALTENEDTYCYNGGPGATSCSIDGGVTILGYGVSAACSVSCGDGYYACCGMRCKCIG